MIYYVTLKRLGGSGFGLLEGEEERHKKEIVREGGMDGYMDGGNFDLDEVTSDSSDWVSQLL